MDSITEENKENKKHIIVTNTPIWIINELEKKCKLTGKTKTQYIRDMLKDDMLGKEIKNILSSEDWYELFKFITSKKKLCDQGGFWRPVQIYGTTGAGKTHIVKSMLKETAKRGWSMNFDFTVIDPLDEYDFIEKRNNIMGEGSYRVVPQSFGINMMEEMGLMQLYNQICNAYKKEYLEKKKDFNRIIVFDEAHRFSNCEIILREVRHSFRCVFVTNKQITDNFPTVQISSSSFR